MRESKGYSWEELEERKRIGEMIQLYYTFEILRTTVKTKKINKTF